MLKANVFNRQKIETSQRDSDLYKKSCYLAKKPFFTGHFRREELKREKWRFDISLANTISFHLKKISSKFAKKWLSYSEKFKGRFCKKR